MTITERNQKLYELRERLNKARAEVAWIEQEIWLTNERYKNQDLDLYKEMFCNWLTTTDMQFQITDIQFDCYLDEDGWDESDQICTEEKLNEEYVGTIWEAEDGDDLIDEISTASGWCIKSIDYRIILDDIDSPEHESTFEIDYTTQAWQLARCPLCLADRPTPCL